MLKFKNQVICLLVFCLVFIFVNFTAYAESYQEYANQVEERIKIMQNQVDEIENEVIPERKVKVDELISEKEALIDEYEETIEYYKNQEQDDYTKQVIGEREADKKFQEELLNVLKKYRDTGLSLYTDEGVQAYNQLDALSPVGFGTFGYGYTSFEALSGVYFAIIEKSILADLISLCQESKEKGITEEKYNELHETYSYWLGYEVKNFGEYTGTKLVSEQEPIVYNLLLNLGREYEKKNAKSPEPSDEPVTTTKPVTPDEDDEIVIESPNAKIPRGIAFVKGMVQVKRRGSDKWIRARRGMPLGAGDIVRTLRNSYAELGCGNGDEFSTFSGNDIILQEVSTITVPDKVLKVEKKSNVRVMMDHVVKKTYEIFKQDEFEVDTPTSIAGIRGTDFIIDVDETGNTTYFLKEGSIVVSNKFDGSETTLKPGQKVTAYADMTLSDPQEMTQMETDMFSPEYKEKYVSDILTAEKEKNVTVTEEGIMLLFVPEKDGEYIFNLEVEQKSGSENWEKTNYHLVMELFDDDMTLLASNIGDKYELYDNSYNTGSTIAIGEGGDTGDSPMFHKSIKQNCMLGEKYYVNLLIPDTGTDSELLENVKIVEIGEYGEIVETDGQETLISRNATVSVSYNLASEALEKNEKNNSTAIIILISLIIIIAILSLIFIRKIKNKGDSFHKNNEAKKDGSSKDRITTEKK